MTAAALSWGFPVLAQPATSTRAPLASRRFLRLALLASAMVHAVLFAHWQLTREVPAPAESAKAPELQIALVMHAPAPQPDVMPMMPAAMPEPEHRSAPVELPPPPKPVAIQPQPVPQSTPTAKPTVAAKPEVRQVAPALAETKPAQPVEKVTTQPVIAPAVTSPVVDAAAYRNRLLAHIEAHKFYPLAARRRGIEGAVEVSFTLGADGAPHDVRLQGGPGLLQRAAEETVQRAAPLPLPPGGIATPYAVHYAMRFALADAK